MGVVEIDSASGITTYGYEGRPVVTIGPKKILVTTYGQFTAAARRCLQACGFKCASVASRHFTFNLPGLSKTLHFQSSAVIWFQDDLNTKLDRVFIDGKEIWNAKK